MSFCLILALFYLYLLSHSPLCSFDICKINLKIIAKYIRILTTDLGLM